MRLRTASTMKALLVATGFGVMQHPGLAQPPVPARAVLTASDASIGDWFGARASASGNTLAVGAYFDDDACSWDINCNSGSVYVFEKEGPLTEWIHSVKVHASDETRQSYFGYSVDIDDNTMVVGAYAYPNGELDGAAYVFERVGAMGQWIETKRLEPPDPVSDLILGQDVAISGDTVVVGAPGDSYPCPQTPNICLAGSAYVYSRNAGGAGNWGFVRKLISPDGVAQQLFGMSVALDGDALVVSAPGADPNGAAFVFERDLGGTDNWGLRARLDPSDQGPTKGLLGWWPDTIDIREDAVVAGAPTDSRSCGGGDLRCGVVHVFERDAGGPNTWGEATVISPPVPDGEGRFGGSVTVVAPGYFVATQVGPLPGAAYAFVRTEGGAWDTPVSLPPPDWPGENYDWGYGATATSTSEFVALGAYLADHACPGDPNCDSGAVYVFEAGAVNLIFADGFESGDLTRW